MSPARVVSVVAVAAVGLLSGEALACKFRCFGTEDLVLPRDGTTDVARNVQVVWDSLGRGTVSGPDADGGMREYRPSLVAADGTVVDAEVEQFPLESGFTRILVRPRALLAPGTRYTLVDGMPDAPFRRVTTFTTGEVEDLQPPRFSEPVRLDIRNIREPRSSTCASRNEVDVLARGEDDHSSTGSLRLRIYRGEGADSIDLSAPALELRPEETLLGHSICRPGFAPAEGGQYAVRISVVDEAGNESEPGPVIPVSLPDVSGGTPLGCSAAGIGGAGLPLLLLVLARKRRRCA